MKSCKKTCVLLIKWTNNILGTNWSIENAISNLLKLWCKGGNAELGWIFFSIPKSNNTRGTVIEKLVRYYSLIQHEIKKLHLGPVLGPLCQNNSSNFQSLCCYKKLYAREPQRIQCINLLQNLNSFWASFCPKIQVQDFFQENHCRRIPWIDFSDILLTPLGPKMPKSIFSPKESKPLCYCNFMKEKKSKKWKKFHALIFDETWEV